MKLEERPGGFALYKEKTEVGCCQLTRTAAGADAVSYTHLTLPTIATV